MFPFACLGLLAFSISVDVCFLSSAYLQASRHAFDDFCSIFFLVNAPLPFGPAICTTGSTCVLPAAKLATWPVLAQLAAQFAAQPAAQPTRVRTVIFLILHSPQHCPSAYAWDLCSRILEARPRFSWDVLRMVVPMAGTNSLTAAPLPALSSDPSPQICVNDRSAFLKRLAPRSICLEIVPPKVWFGWL